MNHPVSQTPATESTVSLNTPVSEVVLFEDRARVIRSGEAELPSGWVRAVVADVTPLLSDKTLTARVVGNDGAVLVDIHVRRHWLVESREPDQERIREWRRQRRRLQREIAALSGKRSLVGQEVDDRVNLRNHAFQELVEDVAWGRADREAWNAWSTELYQQELTARQSRIALDFQLKKCHKDLARLEKKIHLAKDRHERCRASLELLLQVRRPGRIGLRIEYMTGNACWRPWHSARLQGRGDSRRLLFTVGGSVWQNTGESWPEARLSFSVERLSAGVKPPRLASDRLSVVPKSDAVQLEVREQEIQDLAPELMPATDTVERPEKTDEKLPGIDDGGHAVHFHASGPMTIPADGRPHRVELFSFETDAQTGLVLIPPLGPIAGGEERDYQPVVMKSVQKNTAAQPVLAGPVDLIRDSGYVGRTSILFVAPGEPFALGWGPDPDLRVKRVATSARQKSKVKEHLLPAFNNKSQLWISNLGAESKRIDIISRLPVSEVKQVKIIPDRSGTTHDQWPDADGLQNCQITLEAHGATRVAWAYRLQKSKKAAMAP